MSFTGRRHRFLFWLSFASLIMLSGCIEKTISPAVVMTVTKVTPDPVTATITQDASGTLDITTTPLSIELSVETGVPSRIVSYSVTYESRIGEPLPEIVIQDMPLDLYLAPSTKTTVSIPVYTLQVANLLINTPSDIAPLRVTASLRIHDVNGNEIVKDAHCQLSKPQ